MASKIAAPTAEHQDMVIVVSDEEEEEHMGEGSLILSFEVVNVPVVMQDGGRLQLVPRLCGWSKQSRLFSLDMVAFLRVVGREAGFSKPFWAAIGFGWGQN
ncbi:hypothetical protein NDU88_004244 [Pleurodeles waltl]|uniref:Uncharacterized protein n=1 Tax=Pleurodeles waltl TaxID=8319 RepID=A0AAV7KXT6_PLEWA|nr:hypothetical protein NDU88_004244 [Pleurodeles waltl]